MLTRVHSSGRTCGLYPPNEHQAGRAFPHSVSVTSSNLANVHTNRQQKHSTNMPLLPPKHTLPTAEALSILRPLCLRYFTPTELLRIFHFNPPRPVSPFLAHVPLT